MDLADADINDLIDCMKAVEVPAGQVIYNIGDMGAHFYVIERGSCDVFELNGPYNSNSVTKYVSSLMLT